MTQALGDDIDQVAELATNWDVHLKYLGQCYVIVPADDTGVFGHTQKTQTPMSSVKWKKQKNA